MVAKVLIQTGVHTKARAVLYKAVFQTVLLYGCEIWVFTESMMTVLEGFHHRVDQRLLGLTARRGDGGEWECTPVATALEVIGLRTMRE